MKWKNYPLAADDNRAMAQILENFQSAANRTLVRKLRAQFSLGTGELFAIALDELDLDSLVDFSYATYKSGKQWDEPMGTVTVPLGGRPIDGLISLLADYLRRSDRGVVLIQDWVSTRSQPYWDDPARKSFCIPTQRAFLNDEVFNVIAQPENDLELIEETIRDASQRWFVGVAAQHVTMPEDDMISEGFVDEVVRQTKYVFVPAFDAEGYLIWAPKGQKVELSRQG